MLTDQQFERKWGEIKGGLRNLWGRLTDDELDQYKDDIYEVTGLVQSKYSESKDDIREKLDRLMDSFDNDTDKNIDPDVASYHRSPLGDRDEELFDQSPHTPNRPRTSEVSQLQDTDKGLRSEEEVSFAEKTYDKAKDGLEDPRTHTNYSGANPGRSGFGPARDRQDATLKEKSDFDSDRNARH